MQENAVPVDANAVQAVKEWENLDGAVFADLEEAEFRQKLAQVSRVAKLFMGTI